ncbi:helix-turn-helix domain-containing protein [Halobacteriovorax sp. DPLXC-1]|uniref:helix-turn-helix domain-containing protein n=1 Tax=Halobacteriovorax sp. DPLXC-1 TaxID=3110771 RepID=UPI002FF2AA32
MQNTTFGIHIMNSPSSMKSFYTSVLDLFDISMMITPEFKYHVTQESKRPFNKTMKCDFLIIPPSFDAPKATGKERDIITTCLKNKTTIIACCGGVFKIASLGILDNKEVTTHWYFKEKLISEYPSIIPSLNKAIVRSQENIITVGGVLNYVDLIVYMIRKTQGIKKGYIFNQFVQGPGIRERQFWDEDLSEEKYSSLFKVLSKLNTMNQRLSVLSKEFGKSPRTMQRYLRDEYNISFRELLNLYRFCESKKLLYRKYSVKEIAIKVGFEDEMSFRRFFKKQSGMTISKYREYLLS